MILVDSNEATKFKGMKHFEEYSIRYRIYKKHTGLWDFAILGQKHRKDGTVQEKTYLIERKTWWDLLGSAQSRDHHLFQQLKRLARAKDRAEEGTIVIPALLIEGSVAAVLKSRFGKSWSEKRIYRFLGGLYAGWGGTIQFFSSSSPRRTVMMLGAMDDNINTDTKKAIPYRITDQGPAHTPEQEAHNMIMGKKGVGGETCKKLFDAFGSVVNIVAQPEKRLQQAAGGKTGSDLYRVVNLWLSSEPEQTTLVYDD